MAKLLKLRRGTTSQHSSFTGAEGEVTVDTDKETLVVHDGSTAGGHPVAAQDMANVPAGTILGTQLENSGVSAGQYGSSSAIPIVTVDAQGLVTAASTTAIDSTTIANGSSSVSVANNGAITSNANHDFSAGIDVTGNITTQTGDVQINTGDLDINHTHPRINFNDSNANPDWSIINNDGALGFYDQTNAAYRFQVNTDGHVDVNGNLDFGAGIDVTGNITNTGTITSGGNIEISSTYPSLVLTDTNNNSDYRITNNDGQLIIFDSTNGAHRLNVNADGHIDILGNLDVGAGVDVTGNITVTGTVDGVDVAALKTSKDSLSTTNGVLLSSVTVPTQPQSNDSTKIATTAYVRTAITEASPFPSGTKMLFQQTSAPTGWTKQTSGVDNKALRVVSGTASSGGTNAFSNTLTSRSITANAANATQGGNITVANTTAGGNVSIDSATTGGTVDSHTLTINEIPSHNHNYGMQSRRGNNTSYRNNAAGLTGTTYIASGTRNYTHAGNAPSSSVGGDGGHSHGFTGGSHNHNGTLSGTAHNHNATFTGSAHNHSISVTNLDMGVQYLDVIIAAKD